MSLYEDVVNVSVGNDDFIEPHNEMNKLVQASDVEAIFKKHFNMGIEVGDINVYIRAFTHSSYIKNEYYELNSTRRTMDGVVPLQEYSCETYEFVGDSVLKPIITSYLFKRYPYENEGFMTYLKIKLEDKNAYYNIAHKLGLGDFLLISKQTEYAMGRYSKKLLEDCFESFIAAVYFDQGFEICRQAFWHILETEIPWSQYIYQNTEYKGQLLNFYHKNNWAHPEYILLKTTVINNKKMYVMGVKDNEGNVIAEGEGYTKKVAEQYASMKALYNFGVLTKDQMSEF